MLPLPPFQINRYVAVMKLHNQRDSRKVIKVR